MKQNLKRRWKPNYFLEKWSWAEVTVEPEALQGHSEQEPRRPTQGIYHTSCLTTESHETHHDLSSLTNTGKHFVLFGF